MSPEDLAYITGRVDATDYEPMMIDGERIGEGDWLRTEGSHGNEHEACIWRTEAPATYEYLFTGDESFVVLEGSVSIELPDIGETVELKAGDTASFDKGAQSVWNFSEPFKKFTVISA
jgi:uncharacterized cupin superfamily protein